MPTDEIWRELAVKIAFVFQLFGYAASGASRVVAQKTKKKRRWLPGPRPWGRRRELGEDRHWLSVAMASGCWARDYTTAMSGTGAVRSKLVQQLKPKTTEALHNISTTTSLFYVSLFYFAFVLYLYWCFVEGCRACFTLGKLVFPMVLNSSMNPPMANYTQLSWFIETLYDIQ